MVQRNSPPDDNVEKLPRDIQQSAPERKNNIDNQMVVGMVRRKTSGGPNKKPVLPEILKFPLLTTVHALNHLPIDKMVMFMNQYW